MRKLTALCTLIILSFSSLKAQKTGDLFDGSYVHDIRLTFDVKNWVEQLDSMRQYGDGMLLGKVMIDGTTYNNVGIAYAKSPTYAMAGRRNPWFIKLNFVDKKQNHQGFKSITVSQALRDPSMVREILSYEIARKYFPSPQANFLNLTVNGENRGIHVNVETINEEFLQKNFNNTEGAFFRCVPDTRNEIKGDCERVYGALKFQKEVRCMMMNFEMQSKEGWDDLIELTRLLNEDPNNVGKILNLDRTLWFLAFNNVIVNLNGYNGQFSGNYYLYKDKNTNFNFIPTEMNLAFGSLKNTNGTSDLDFKGLVELDPLLNIENASKPLIAQLLKNQDFKKIYFAHIRQILADWFENDAYKTKAESLQKLIALYFEQDKTPPYQAVDFQRSLAQTVGNVTKIPGIVELMSQRMRFLKKHPEMLNQPPVVSQVSVTNRKKFANQPITEFHVKAKVDRFPRRVRLFYRPTGSTANFTEATMFDDGKNHDAEAGDKIFGIAIAPQGKFDSIEYYIIAENASSLTFDPPNYNAMTRKVSLAELNK